MIVRGCSRRFVPHLTKLARTLRLLSIAFLATCGLPQEQFAGTPPDLKIEVLVRGLDTPWAIDFTPDDKIFITERPGRIRIVEGGRLLPEPWMILEVVAIG
ncbi:MAG TPA: PQQ-dependent sugar dehydrogenase, partial [Candidatus Binatia bacterium]|nr:PQQ-dependent sugar dehydrogenase [Candidatus Binatia bacterium]